MTGFDWPALVRAGLRELRLNPAEFWALTPVELAVKLGRDGAAGPMDRGTLASLMARFPDRNEETRHAG